MTDRERVIKGLEYGINDDIDSQYCPYYEESRIDIGLMREVPVNLLRDALALLKAQEPVKPVMRTAHAQGADDVWYECSKCGGFLSVNWNGVKVCKKCGRAVKWDG